MTFIDQMKKEIAELKASIQRDKLQAINDKIAKQEAKGKGNDLAKREREENAQAEAMARAFDGGLNYEDVVTGNINTKVIETVSPELASLYKERDELTSLLNESTADVLGDLNEQEQETHDIANKQVEHTAVANQSATVNLKADRVPPIDYTNLAIEQEFSSAMPRELFEKQTGMSFERYIQIATPEEVQKANAFVRPNSTKQAQHEQNLQSGAYNTGRIEF
ncbi:hypothetical protein P4388_31505 [Bacillus thuringiensis]|uniref:Uncharacterized protein n=1 Tax=Bacillus thuringiensis serovar mexicanensis TaxID=180868 RepID=A0A242W0W2_BACTU|nr:MULTISPECIES: hypothetical protein [Bacillus cereus group]MED3353044.1 hypothetical protein [Bacillus thuringiensis]EEM56348.1 hypothetical protein bthur0007_58030 [Bacillus thuringiensis serovar monterrey BGSC 4AJ1]MEB9673570.1 hypothetical protein [Bacillus anthracis]OTW45076.1 hypothetical protein BK699_27765 [Bacillus thuringiensis serovar mexicanensis]OTX06249.1 hypothetical protein BK705_11005 [Bacillus thuringiensis serovar monterrey]